MENLVNVTVKCYQSNAEVFFSSGWGEHFSTSVQYDNLDRDENVEYNMQQIRQQLFYEWDRAKEGDIELDMDDFESVLHSISIFVSPLVA